MQLVHVIQSTILAGVMLLGSCAVRGDVIVYIYEDAGDVHMSWEAGTLNRAGLTSAGRITGADNLFAGAFNIIGGGAVSGVEGYTGATVTASAGWTQGGSVPHWHGGSGASDEGFLASANWLGNRGDRVWVGEKHGNGTGTFAFAAADNYVSGYTLAGLSLTAGESLKFSWASDSMTFITSAPVPEPTSFALLGLGSFGFGFVTYRRRKKQCV